MMATAHPGLRHEQRLHFRDAFKAGRAQALADAEGFTHLVFALERLGRLLEPGASNLGKMEPALTQLAVTSPLATDLPAQHPACHTPFDVLFLHVRKARNAAMHEGAYARCMTTHLTQLALVLEDALMSSSRHVGDFMVRHPTCAAMWQPISFLRQVMLSHSYSFLPVEVPGDDKPWRVVTDREVASFIHDASDQRAALRTTLEEAVAQGLTLHTPFCCARDTDAATALRSAAMLPLLVVEQGHLLGIVTAFDLL